MILEYQPVFGLKENNEIIKKTHTHFQWESEPVFERIINYIQYESNV